MFHQVMVVEDALNRTQARSRSIPLTILVLDRARPDARKAQAARPVSDQLSAQAENPPLDNPGRLCGTMLRGAGRRAKPRPGMTSVILDPLVDPPDALLEFLRNRRDRHSGAVQPNRRPTPLCVPAFGACHAFHTPPPAGGKYAALHDVLNTARVELHDVLNTWVVYDVLTTNNYVIPLNMALALTIILVIVMFR
jgi:hypothetical protein